MKELFETNLLLLVLLATSLALSLFLIARIWSEEGSIAFRSIVSVFTLIPFVGPVFYYFMTDQTPPQRADLQDRNPRGTYFFNWISEKPEVEKKIRELEERSRNSGAKE